MEWDLEWGRHRENLISLHEAHGFIPGALSEEPDLPDYLQPYMQAFRSLNAARTFTVAVGAAKALRLPEPLVVSEILTMADEYGLPRREFLFIAQAMDQTYMAHELDKL